MACSSLAMPFTSSGASSSSLNELATPEQSSVTTPAYLKILSIRDVQRWLAKESIACGASRKPRNSVDALLENLSLHNSDMVIGYS